MDDYYYSHIYQHRGPPARVMGQRAKDGKEEVLDLSKMTDGELRAKFEALTSLVEDMRAVVILLTAEAVERAAKREQRTFTESEQKLMALAEEHRSLVQ